MVWKAKSDTKVGADFRKRLFFVSLRVGIRDILDELADIVRIRRYFADL